jgi:iron complex outermembrane receptor protein
MNFPRSVRKRLAVSIRHACLLTTTTVAAALTFDGAVAQEADIEQVTITGSRITRPGLTSPTPVTAIERDELEVLGPGTLMDGLDALPQFMGSTTLSDTENYGGGGYLGSGGQSQLNLRGMGVNRTLVLINNRRQPATSRTGSFDISMLPQILVQRTEVVTGGASAAYGSDAVAGVTNFIINENFEGFEANVQGGITEIGDADNMRLSLGAGLAIGEKGHFVVGVEGFKAAGIPDIGGRDWWRAWCNLDMGATATPRRVLAEDCRNRTQTYGGFVASGPLVGTMFLDDGSPAQFQSGSVLDAAATSGLARNTITGNSAGGDGGQFATEQMRRAAQERASIFLNYKHEISDSLRASVATMYGHSFIDNERIGYFLFSQWAPTIYSGNPYLPAAVQQAMDTNNVQSFALQKRVIPKDPLHNSWAPLTTDMFTLSTSLEGDLDNGWNWNWYYQWGESNRDVELHGARVDRIYRAIDAVRHPVTGAIVCASTLRYADDGCKPLNILGVGNASPEALAYVHDKMFTDARIRQQATEFVLNGEVWDGFGAGPVFLAVGANWRRDEIDQISGDALSTPPAVDGQGPVTAYDPAGNLMYRGLPPIYEKTGNIIDRVGAASFKGSVDVWETFAESIIPLVSNQPWMERVESSLAVRHTDYEESGDVLSWKGGLIWDLNEQLRLRVTRSRDIRAGNLSEMFDTTQLYAFMNDPWNPQVGTYTVKQINGGNPGVAPEEADTLTYGFVYQPAWAPGAAFTMDYYDIKIASAISTIGAQPIVDYCFQQNLFCDQISFGSGGSGRPGDPIESVDNTTINVGAARTRGIDYELSYRMPLQWFQRNDNLSLRLIASRLLESTITPFDSPTASRLGGTDLQRINATFIASYMAGPASLSWTTRWVSDGVQDPAWVTGIDVDNNRIPSHHVSNLRLNWNLERVGNGGSSVYLSINNVFDRNPGDLRGFSGIYDILGRNYTLGMRYKL